MSYYLVARDVKTNDFKMIRGFDTLEQADIYTTSSHNPKDLGKKIWRGTIVPSQELDFFLVKERSNKKSLKTMDVLYSDSKEIRNIAIKKDSDSVDNLLQHFYHKLMTSPSFYRLVEKSTNISKLYDMSLPTKDYVDQMCLKSKDENGNFVEYPAFRKMVEAFSRYEDKKRKKTNLNRVLLNRLILERKMLEKLNNNEKQISVFDYLDPIDCLDCEAKYDDVLLETIDFIDKLPNGFISIKEGKARVSNNIYTTKENLDILDSLLDQEIGYLLIDYLNNKSALDKTISEEPKEDTYIEGQISMFDDIYLDDSSSSKSNDKIKELKETIKRNKLKLIDILSNNQKVLSDTHKLMNIVSVNQSKLLGDNYEYRKN